MIEEEVTRKLEPPKKRQRSSSNLGRSSRLHRDHRNYQKPPKSNPELWVSRRRYAIRYLVASNIYPNTNLESLCEWMKLTAKGTQLIAIKTYGRRKSSTG